MAHQNGAQVSEPQYLTLPSDKILVSRQALQEMLCLLSLTTPIVGKPKPPERHWSGIKTMKLARVRKLLKRVLSDD